ncbi:antioxidant, AhpC/TSA family [Synechococcus sp. PCC 7335]|uniref:peroxiredoxin family protein n=1 Tax=Synechococcus sp. (strain ATCC 29403 / PCC 7335) TaxID=91464 RepID=UPI00017EE411|nr:peroxiredoxin family protein [Synechococcus sp. PCC 7335]EDX87804.1 antioxidant, AhpC/TSA family [Synechococcus sp. PCC 7335]
MQLTPSNLQGLFNQRFFRNFLPLPAHCRFQIGEILPDFSLTDTNQQVHQLSGYRGRPVVVLFTRIFTEKQYCPFCYPHILSVNKAYSQFVGLGVAALMVTSTDALQSQKIQRDLSLQLPLLVDSDCKVFRRYGTGQALGAPLPAQFVLDAQGRLRFQHLFSFAHTNATPERLLWAVRNL